jgi:hypothetical protein
MIVAAKKFFNSGYRAQQRIRNCESLINDPSLTSTSIKDGNFLIS